MSPTWYWTKIAHGSRKSDGAGREERRASDDHLTAFPRAAQDDGHERPGADVQAVIVPEQKGDGRQRRERRRLAAASSAVSAATNAQPAIA